MAIDSERLRKRLAAKITSYFPELCDARYDFRLEREIAASYSTVYIFRSDERAGERYGVAVKVFSGHSAPGEIAAAQYSSLRSVWPAFKDCVAFGVPRPLDYFADLGAIVTEAVPGISLQSFFGKHRWCFGWSPAFVRVCHRGGQWLKFFHQSTHSGRVSMDIGAKGNAARANLLKLAGFDISAKLCARVERALQSAAEKLTNIECDAALVHGDFTLDNLLVAHDRMIALDLTGRDRNAIYHDLATFLNSLRLLEMTWPVARSAARANSDAFLSGYFNGSAYDRTALWFLRIAGLIATSVEVFGRRQSQWFSRLWLRRFFSGLLNEFARAGESVA